MPTPNIIPADNAVATLRVHERLQSFRFDAPQVGRAGFDENPQITIAHGGRRIEVVWQCHQTPAGADRLDLVGIIETDGVRYSAYQIPRLTMSDGTEHYAAGMTASAAPAQPYNRFSAHTFVDYAIYAMCSMDLGTKTEKIAQWMLDDANLSDYRAKV